MAINERISELIKLLKDTENSFTKCFQISTSVVVHSVNTKCRKSYPSEPVLKKLLAIERDGQFLSGEWLMLGEMKFFYKIVEVLDVDVRDLPKPSKI